MKKHMLTNYKDHQCKECQHKLPTFMELFKRVAKNHFKDKQGDNDDSKENNSEEDQTEEKDHSVKEKDKVSRRSRKEVNDWREQTSKGLLAILIAIASEQLEVVRPPACSFTPARLTCLSLKYIIYI